MLKHLLIENYALIEKLDIDFDRGFSIITGETGAGKSILVGALSLILGQRADTKVLHDKELKCIVEGTFLIKDYGLEDTFEKYELDYDDQTILRREINPQGKSRAFINDTPVNLNVLKNISEKLVDIHSQHESLLLNKTYFQFNVLDSFCGHHKLLNDYKLKYAEFNNLKNKLNELTEKEKETRANLDYYKFQYEELEKAGLDQIENYKEMESELNVLENASEIKQNLQNAHYLLADSDNNILEQLTNLQNIVLSIDKYDKKYSDILSRIKSAYIEIKDIGNELSLSAESIIYDPERSALLTEKIDSINKLIMKHGASEIDELVDIKEDYENKINEIEFMDEEIESIKEKLLECEKEVFELGEKLSESRQNNFKVVNNRISELLRSLGIPNAQFKIEHNRLDEPGPFGLDFIRFKFSANLGSEMQDISKVASGGEISRLMLSIKSLVTEKRVLPTVIFDEIDTGVSGEVASKISSIFDNMSENMQVLSITHLPQIASRGKSHYFVYKVDENKATKTKIKKLSENERIEEIAKMLGGENLTDSARKTAEEMIGKN